MLMARRPGQIHLGRVVIPMAVSMVVDIASFFLWPFLIIGLSLLIWGVAHAAVIRCVAALPGGARINRQLSEFNLWDACGAAAD